MARKIILCTWVVVGLSFIGGASADEAELIPGLITAGNTDIFADDGSLLEERVNVGDKVFIISNYKPNKKGWVRISRSEGDLVGIGWVDTKSIRSFSRFKSGSTEPSSTPTDTKGEKTILAPDLGQAKYDRVGVLSFVASEPGDSMAGTAQSAFVSSARKSGKFNLISGSYEKEKIDVESIESLAAVARTNNLDGIFVGKVSGEVAGSRLLQVRFFGKEQESFVIEKTTRLPNSKNLASTMDTLISSIAAQLASK